MAESKSEAKHQTKAEKKKEKKEKRNKSENRKARIDTAKAVGKGALTGLIAVGILLFIAGVFVLFWNLLIVNMVSVATPIDLWIAFWFIIGGIILVGFYVGLLRRDQSTGFW
jgi:uncharacterized membrane protein